jgi:hypothetical protein
VPAIDLSCHLLFHGYFRVFRLGAWVEAKQKKRRQRGKARENKRKEKSISSSESVKEKVFPVEFFGVGRAREELNQLPECKGETEHALEFCMHMFVSRPPQ